MNKHGNCGEQNCVDVGVTAHVGECNNVITPPILTPAGTRIVRLPVTLQELTVRSSLVANIHFPEPVLEIKDIKKRVKIIQCRLLLPGVPQGSDPFALPATPVNLFIKGFVRKNIQYATPSSNSTADCVSSELRSLTVDVPFECVTTITSFLTPPQRPFFNTRSEFDFFRAQELGHGFPEKDELLSSDLSQFHQESRQFYNQLPYCELIDSHIVEWDEAIDRRPLPNHKPFEEGTFQNIVEKMFLEFTVKILQNQQVRITAG
ncbi:CsxC family protein [Neobacillus mesonae]|uniref:DUF3794 domain-containing protein n=1 Tax=Neobacillus mesonae TaxID=1193713 RepID=A0A3Q9R077_9BACI|nr:DUF3794 domain-containing protein [Neobacillus mesonae]AZU64745.1 DUF3794 domain-containing protein [Neobacillus mesonae]